MKIVETDMFGGDYPNEKFLNLPSLPEEQARRVCEVINTAVGQHSGRYWKVVENDYKLQPGFEP